MKPFFQHLKPASAESPDSADVGRYQHLLDLDRRLTLQTGVQELVEDADGQLFLVPVALPGQELEAYDNITPQGLLPGRSMSPTQLMTGTRRLLSFIEASEGGTGIVTMKRGTVTKPTVTVLNAFPLGPAMREPWAVAHVEGERWHVNGGLVRWPTVTGFQEVEGDAPTPIVFYQESYVPPIEVSIREGWIFVTAGITINDETRGYDLSIGGVQASSSWSHSLPTREAVPDSGADRWQSGTMILPLAYVSAPGVESAGPIIRQTRSNVNIVFTTILKSENLPRWT